MQSETIECQAYGHEVRGKCIPVLLGFWFADEGPP